MAHWSFKGKDGKHYVTSNPQPKKWYVYEIRSETPRFWAIAGPFVTRTEAIKQFNLSLEV